jgi:hypothetical protein
MADKALENALRVRDEIAAKINRLAEEIEVLRRGLRRAELFIAEWHAFAEGRKPTGDLAEGVGAAAGASTARAISAPGMGIAENVVAVVRRGPRPDNSSKEMVAAYAKRILEEHGEPMSRTDLYRELVARGLKITGKNPEMVLSTMLWRMGKDVGVIRLKSGGYWLADRSNPNEQMDESNSQEAIMETLGLTEDDSYAG